MHGGVLYTEKYGSLSRKSQAGGDSGLRLFMSKFSFCKTTLRVALGSTHVCYKREALYGNAGDSQFTGARGDP